MANARQRAALAARLAARRDAERVPGVKPSPEVARIAPGATLTVVPARSARYLTHVEDVTRAPRVSRRYVSAAEREHWDAVAKRADAAAAARDALAVATGRGGGSPVRGYRSRRGYQWPGHSPVISGDVTTRR